MSNVIKAEIAKQLLCPAMELETFRVQREQLGGAGLQASERFDVTPQGRPDAGQRDSTPDSLQRATAAAEAILADAKAKAQKVLEQAKAQGFELGKQEGAKAAQAEALQAAKAEVAGAVGAFKKASEALDSVRNEALDNSDKELIGLVLGVTRLILDREIKSDKRLVLDQIKRAASILGEADEVIVKLHPLDLKTAQSNVDDLAPKGKSMKFQMVADKSVDRGGCLLECNRGKVDARISTQLERLRAAFEEGNDAEGAHANFILETDEAQQSAEASGDV